MYSSVQCPFLLQINETKVKIIGSFHLRLILELTEDFITKLKNLLSIPSASLFALEINVLFLYWILKKSNILKHGSNLRLVVFFSNLNYC